MKVPPQGVRKMKTKRAMNMVQWEGDIFFEKKKNDIKTMIELAKEKEL